MKRILLLAVCAIAFTALFLESAAVSNGRPFDRTAIILADNDGEPVLFEALLSSLEEQKAEKEAEFDHIEIVYQDDPRYEALREKIYKDTPSTNFVAKISRRSVQELSLSDRWVSLGCVVEERFPNVGKKKCASEMRVARQRLLNGYHHVRNHPPSE